MHCFITGSQKYGMPVVSKSDTDLVLLIDDVDITYLLSIADEWHKFDPLDSEKDADDIDGDNSDYKGSGYSIRIDRLNILAFTNKNEVFKWYVCTKFCEDIIKERGRKLTKEESKAIFKLYIEENVEFEDIKVRLKLYPLAGNITWQHNIQ